MRKTVAGVTGLVELAALAGLLVCSGCAGIAREMRPYTFLEKHKPLGAHYGTIYSVIPAPREQRANLLITRPDGEKVRFSTGGSVLIGAPKQKPLQLQAGVYPFQLVDNPKGTIMLSGALMVYNIDATVGLATLGKTAETWVFNDELLRKAADGQLATYTIAFDEKDIITYWLGNRITPYFGGQPTVELDFSGTPGISEVRINGMKLVKSRCTVPVYSYVTQNGYTRPEKKEHRLELKAGSRSYHGYVRNLADNEFTAFVRIPCSIPSKLLDAASAGTVSRFTVQSTGDEKQDVAEIVISGK